MCVVFYVAAEKSFEPIAWSDEAPAFYVDPEIVPGVVLEHFPDKHVTYVGSHEGCGCGFAVSDDGEERERETRSLAELCAFLARIAPCDVLVCYDGLEAEPVDETHELSRDGIADSSFWNEVIHAAFEDRSQLVRIS